jgi:hypothetical protein
MAEVGRDGNVEKRGVNVVGSAEVRRISFWAVFSARRKKADNVWLLPIELTEVAKFILALEGWGNADSSLSSPLRGSRQLGMTNLMDLAIGTSKLMPFPIIAG